MSKVILTNGQFEALKDVRKNYVDSEIMELHACGSGQWRGSWSDLNDVTYSQLANALEFGYVTKEEVAQESEKVADKCNDVTKPSHYTTGEIEVIDYIADKLTPDQYIGYCMGNVIKYTSRWEHKGGVQDLEKAQVYLKWAIEMAKEMEK